MPTLPPLTQDQQDHYLYEIHNLTGICTTCTHYDPELEHLEFNNCGELISFSSGCTNPDSAKSSRVPAHCDTYQLCPKFAKYLQIFPIPI